jgi:hypothetical protein
VTTLMEFDTAEGAIVVQQPVPPGQVAPVNRTKVVVTKMEKSMTEVLGIVRGLAQDFATTVQNLPLESAELEFGLQFTAKGNLYVVEAEAGAAVRVKLTVKP